MNITISNDGYHLFEIVISIIRNSDIHKWADLVICVNRIYLVIYTNHLDYWISKTR